MAPCFGYLEPVYTPSALWSTSTFLLICNTATLKLVLGYTMETRYVYLLDIPSIPYGNVNAFVVLMHN